MKPFVYFFFLQHILLCTVWCDLHNGICIPITYVMHFCTIYLLYIYLILHIIVLTVSKHDYYGEASSQHILLDKTSIHSSPKSVLAFEAVLHERVLYLCVFSCIDWPQFVCLAMAGYQGPGVSLCLHTMLLTPETPWTAECQVSY